MELDGKKVNTRTDKNLASYAIKNKESLGRSIEQMPDPLRGPFQRDRDRIIHCSAFRRLQGKTQVLSPSETDDHIRNRLTHTLEVSQIARDLARLLKLNEDLCEAIALAHDLGHPPFGHGGEQALNQKMKTFNLHFDHNQQTLKILQEFEYQYLGFSGLNLSQEVIEGLQKHEKTIKRADGSFVYCPSIESEVVDQSDEIAYLAADLEDGFRGGYFEMKHFVELKIAKHLPLESIPKESYAGISRKVIHYLIDSLFLETKKNIKKLNLTNREEVSLCQQPIVVFDKTGYEAFRELKAFLYQYYYQSDSVSTRTKEGQRIINETFDYLSHTPRKIPLDFFPNKTHSERACHYIAGMTDRFLIDFWQKWVQRDKGL